MLHIGAILTGVFAELAAGAMAMAMGEYVSVSSQRDVELADLRTERLEHRANPDAELDELTAIYRRRGLDRELARQVAEQLTAVDALAEEPPPGLARHCPPFPAVPGSGCSIQCWTVGAGGVRCFPSFSPNIIAGGLIG